MANAIEDLAKKAVSILVKAQVLDEKVKGLHDEVKDHEKRIAKLEGSCDLNIEKVKVAFLEAKSQLQLPSGEG
jgi:peptidoglycan hydrolase CwlO-like protein